MLRSNACLISLKRITDKMQIWDYVNVKLLCMLLYSNVSVFRIVMDITIYLQYIRYAIYQLFSTERILSIVFNIFTNFLLNCGGFSIDDCLSIYV